MRILLVLLLLVLVSCTSDCELKDESCCVGETCQAVSLLCVEGSLPAFKGCDDNCEPIAVCE